MVVLAVSVWVVMSQSLALDTIGISWTDEAYEQVLEFLFLGQVPKEDKKKMNVSELRLQHQHLELRVDVCNASFQFDSMVLVLWHLGPFRSCSALSCTKSNHHFL